MSVQTDNERTINLLWAIGDEMFDGMLAQITKQVEIAEKPEEECELCGGAKGHSRKYAETLAPLDYRELNDAPNPERPI